MLRDQRLDDLDSFVVFYEKKTKDEYRRDKWKKENHFVPDKDEHGHNDPYKGTYTDEQGVKHRVDLSKSNIYKSPTGAVVRQTAADTDANTLVLGKEFFGEKNKKLRKATQRHEETHLKYHSNTKDGDKSTFSNTVFDSKKKGLLNSSGQQQLLSKEEFDDRMKEVNRDSRIERKRQQHNAKGEIDKKKAKEREKNIKYLDKKYASKNPHTNTMEFEADRGSVNRGSSKKDMQRAARHMVRAMTKNKKKVRKLLQANSQAMDMNLGFSEDFAKKDSKIVNWDKKQKLGDKNKKMSLIEYNMKNLNTINANDARARKKALDDKTAEKRGKKLYN